jgi:hypothetical protein
MAGNRPKPDSVSNEQSDGIDAELVPKDGNNGTEFEGIAGIDAGSGAIDPGSLGDEYERDEFGNVVIGSSGKPRRKRGRKSGGSNGASGGASAGTAKNSRARNSQAIDTLSQTLMIVHMGIAAFTKFDAFQIEKREADSLASSLANVSETFGWEPDPRFTAIAGLVTTSAMIYGPRIYLYREHMKQQAKEKREARNQTVEGSYNPSEFFQAGNVPLQ